MKARAMRTSTRQTMRDALMAMEQALVDLASAYHRYEYGYQEAARTMYDGHGVHRLQELSHAIGLERVDKALANRLRTIGLQAVLEQTLTTGPFGPEWVTTVGEDVDRTVKT